MPSRDPADVRRTAEWKRLVKGVLDRSDVCVWCGHPGARAGGHRYPVKTHPHLALDPDNIDPVHGIEGCPYCPRVWSRRKRTHVQRNCNSEIGARVVGLDAVPTGSGSRDW